MGITDTIYKKLNLPLVPEELIPHTVETNEILWNPPPRSCKINGVYQTNADYKRLQVPVQLSKWIKQNITTDACEEGFCHLGNANTGLPHTDKKRDWTLLYFWDLGGNAVDTVWWQEKNKSFYREEQVLPTDYDDLVEIHRERFTLGSWWLLNARMIHSIENLEHTRHSIQIGFKNPSETIKQWLND